MNIFQKIFSITNEPGVKIICILGFTFRFNIRTFFNLKYKNLPIENNKIVFLNFKGKGFGCNPKYIAQEIIRQNLPYKMVWLCKDTSEEAVSNFPSCVKVVNYKKPEALKELATAKIWIDNQRKIYHIKKGLNKKAGQYYIQTWHGSLGIKKIGVDSPLTEIENDWVPYGIEDAKMLDYVLSNSKFEEDVFKRNFWGHGEILQVGHPRNDIFYKDTTELKNKLYESLNISKSKHICLYVPSYRDNYGLYCYGLEYKNLIKILTQKFGGEWVILVRMHPNLVKYASQIIPHNENIIDVSTYSDIQELLVGSDIAISDYSSCIFDFMLTRRPAFIYATDMEDFDNDRGFYYPLKSTPFPVAENNGELMDNIKNFDYSLYKQKVEEFLREKGCMEDGKASERVVELIKKIIENKG